MIMARTDGNQKQEGLYNQNPAYEKISVLCEAWRRLYAFDIHPSIRYKTAQGSFWMQNTDLSLSLIDAGIFLYSPVQDFNLDVFALFL